MTPAEILACFKVYPNVFFIGAAKPPLTFLSQQHRALNLVWALDETGVPFRETSFAVIGAGLAGLMTSASLIVKGADVSILERTADVMALQQGNMNRFVLPHLFEWPTPGSAYPKTHLPFLNWQANTAGSIASEVIGQWNRVNFLPEFGVEVVGVSHTGRPEIRCANGDVRQFDYVVVTSGFGVEDKHICRHTPFYWRNDDLDQPVVGPGTYTCFISGLGDSGLIDALRISLQNFEHGKFLSWLLSNQWIVEKANNVRTQIIEATPESEAWRQFHNLDIPPEISAELISKRRPNTRVILNGRHPTPLHGDALISTKIAIALMWKLNLIEYKCANLTNVRILQNKRCVINFANDQVPQPEPMTLDKVIVRHGPQSKLRLLLGDLGFNEISSVENETHQKQAAIAQFPVGYLANEFMSLNQETFFELKFALGTFADPWDPVYPAQLPVVFSALNSLGDQLRVEKLSQSFTTDGMTLAGRECVVNWQGMTCEFRIEDGPFETKGGHRAGPVIAVKTLHRTLLDYLLNNDPLASVLIKKLFLNLSLRWERSLTHGIRFTQLNCL